MFSNPILILFIKENFQVCAFSSLALTRMISTRKASLRTFTILNHLSLAKTIKIVTNCSVSLGHDLNNKKGLQTTTNQQTTHHNLKLPKYRFKRYIFFFQFGVGGTPLGFTGGEFQLERFLEESSCKCWRTQIIQNPFQGILIVLFFYQGGLMEKLIIYLFKPNFREHLSIMSAHSGVSNKMLTLGRGRVERSNQRE